MTYVNVRVENIKKKIREKSSLVQEQKNADQAIASAIKASPKISLPTITMWNHPVTPSAASTAAASTNNDIASSSFPNELDFGASVDIQDEMCRTIKSECDEIDRSASTAQTAVKNEERTLHQLSKDYSCAKNEMAGLRRDGGDILDEETMTDDIRRGFKEQFESEVVPHVTASNNNHEEDDGDDAALVSEDEGANNEEHHGIKRVYAHGKFLARKNSELKAKKASMVATAQEIKSGFKNIQAVNDEAANILHMIEARGLDAAKGQGERTIAQLQREVEVENQRNRGVKEAIQAARANSGVNAQTIAEKVSGMMMVYEYLLIEIAKSLPFSFTNCVVLSLSLSLLSIRPPSSPGQAANDST